MISVDDNKGMHYGLFYTEKEAYAEIKRQIDLTGFKSYYWRQSILEDGRIWLDYGSHTHFFYITP